MKRTSFGAMSALLGAALLAPAAAAAEKVATKSSAEVAPSKLVTTARWNAKLPSNWKLTQRCFAGEKTEPQEWVYASANRNVVFRVKIVADKGGSFEKLSDRAIARLNDTMREGEVVKKDTLKDAGRDVFFVLMKGFMVRNSKPQSYLTYRLISRNPAQKSIATLTLSASADRVDMFSQLVDAVMDGFELTPPAVAKGAKK